MDVDMVDHPCTRRRANVDPQIEGLSAVGLAQKRNRPRGELHQLAHGIVIQILDRRAMRNRYDHHMSAGIRIAIQHDEAPATPVQDQVANSILLRQPVTE